MTVTATTINRLRSAFGGEIVTPGDAEYDTARRVWSALFDRRPALVVRPLNVDDVAAAVRLAEMRNF